MVTGMELGTLLLRVLYRISASEDCSLPVDGSIHRFRQSGRLEATDIVSRFPIEFSAMFILKPITHAIIIHDPSCFIKERKEAVTPRCNPLNHTNTMSQLQGIHTRLLINLNQEA